jgi:hypothetical protein
LREVFWDVDDKLEVLMKLTFSDIAAYVPQLLSQVPVQLSCPLLCIFSLQYFLLSLAIVVLNKMLADCMFLIFLLFNFFPFA